MKCLTASSRSSIICIRTSRHRSFRTMTGHGALDDDLRKDLVEPVLADKLLNGREWHELDLFAPLKGRLRTERGRAPRAGKTRRGRTAFSVTTLCSSRCRTMATLRSVQSATNGAVRRIRFRSTLISTVTIPTIRPWNSMVFIKSSCALRWALIALLWSRTPRQPSRCSLSKRHRGMVVWLSCASRRSDTPLTPSGVVLLARWAQFRRRRLRGGST